MMNQFILRPLVFFGGVFYSLNEIPATFQQASLLNPMIYMVNGVRYGFLGVTEVDPNLSLGVLTGRPSSASTSFSSGGATDSPTSAVLSVTASHPSANPAAGLAPIKQKCRLGN